MNLQWVAASEPGGGCWDGGAAFDPLYEQQRLIGDSLQVSEESADIIKGPVCRLQSTLDSSSPAVAAKNRGSVWFVCSGLP